MKRHTIVPSSVLRSTIDLFDEPLALALFRIEQGVRIFAVPELWGMHVTQHKDLSVRTKSRARELWARYPYAAVGIASRPDSTFIKVELDGERGLESWRELAEIHGYYHRTRTHIDGGKQYLFFECRGKSYLKDPTPFDDMFPGILICAEGDYVVDDWGLKITCDPILKAPKWIQERVPNISNSRFTKRGEK